MKATVEVPKPVFTVLNQVFELERKLAKVDDLARFARVLEKIKTAFDTAEAQFVIENPVNQKCDITRTDVETTITGSEHERLVIVEVLKPVIKITCNGVSRIVQKGVVIASASNSEQ